MDRLTRALVESAVEVFQPPGPVIEIGSYQVEGDRYANLRPLFPRRHYLGCDMRQGPGVDRVERLEALTFSDGCAGTVLCLNVIEHAWDFRKGVEEIHRITAPGGLALLSSAFNFRIHAHPDDYWRFTPRAMELLFKDFEGVLYGWQGSDKMPRLVFALGIKRSCDTLAEKADSWRRGTLGLWRQRPSLRARLGAIPAGLLVGRKHLQAIRQWGRLTICVSPRG